MNKLPPKKLSSIRTRHRRTRAVVAVCAAVVAVAAWTACLRWYAGPAPPVVSFAEVDPALADAIETARREVWWSPYSVSAWARLGQLLRAHNYHPESNLCFAQAERLDSTNPRWPYLQGSSLRMEDPDAAIHHLRRAVTLSGGVPDGPELALAETYLQQGQLDDAERHFGHILERDADNARAHLGMGRLAFERDNPRGALTHLKRCASSEWTRKASRILLTQVYRQLGDTAAANQEQAEAMDLPNDRPWPDPFLAELQPLRTGKQVRLARLKALSHEGRSPELRSMAAKLEDDYPDVYWLVEGRVQMDKAHLAAAEQALRKAVQLAPDSVEAHFELGTVLLKEKEYRAGAESFRRVIELEPAYGPAYQGLGQCMRMQGNADEAIRALRAAAQFMPQNAEAHRELGDLLAREGQIAEAKLHLQQALQLQPADPEAKRLLDDLSERR